MENFFSHKLKFDFTLKNMPILQKYFIMFGRGGGEDFGK